MKAFFTKHHRALFYGSWLLLGLIQSRFTELLDDEAYYWVYSKYFDWGYFDHPPMTGLLIKAGYAIFPNELGVRLLPLLLNVLSLVIIEKLTTRKNPFLFYAIALSVAVLQISGFVAVPDIPLIFFTALFFLLYRKFLEDSGWKNTLLLGICMALLLYSKYHAVLIIFFAFLSNIKLATKPRAWLAVGFACLLFVPHLWWQYQHNWVSFRYHLFESNVNPYKLSHTTDYLLGQILLAGPLAGFILLPAAFLYRTKDKTEKGLRYTMVGIYLFFFVSSFRGKVEANWTAPAIVPLLVLSHQYLNQQTSGFASNARRWLKWLLPVNVLLVLFGRVALVVDILPVKAVKERFHAWKHWPDEMRTITKGLPVVFANSYQRASKYWFYTGQMTYSQNWFVNGRNNYNFWPVEDSLLGKRVYFMDTNDTWRFSNSFDTHSPLHYIGYMYDGNFMSFAKVQVITEPSSATIKEGEDLLLKCRFDIPTHYSDFIRTNEFRDSVRIGVFGKKGWIKNKMIPTPFNLKQMDREKEAVLRIRPDLPKGKYFLRFTVSCGPYNSTHNSEKIPLVVK